MPRLHVDGWEPGYGASLEAEAPVGESTARLELDVERPAADWQPLSPPGDVRAPRIVQLVDGVRRIDTRVWVEEAEGEVQPGLAASYAAGVVRCDLGQGVAAVVAAKVERGLFTPSPVAAGLGTGRGVYAYPVRRVKDAEPTAIQQFLAALEVEVSEATREEDDLLVLDGPLRERNQLPRALGYIKTHHRQYLPAELTALVGRLQPGQRSPVFLLGTNWHHYTWYLKLPGAGSAPWSGVVRIEASADLTGSTVIELADRSAVTLPRFASRPYKDPRAPQNLVPIAGLEGRLRRMLGDPRLLVRSLTAAAAA
jgi:hypothetical protein